MNCYFKDHGYEYAFVFFPLVSHLLVVSC